MSLVCIDGDTVTIPFNDAIQYSSTLLQIWIFPDHLFPECRCKLFIPILCRTSCIATAHTCVHLLAGKPRAVVRQIPFFVLERSSTLSSTNATTFPPRLPVAISESTTFSASSGGVEAYSSGLACVLCSFATHLARSLGFFGCPSSVSAHPALHVSHKHVSLETLVYILWRRMYSPSSRLALAHSSGSSHPPLLSSQCQPSHTLSSSCSS